MGIFRLRLQLRAVLGAINELQSAIKKHSESIHAAEEAQNERRNLRKPTPVVVSYDEQTARDAKAEQNRQYGTQDSIRKWTRRAVIAASIYAGIAAVQAFEMYWTTKAVERTNDLVLTQDRRPWVWVEMPSRFQIEVGKPITVPLKIFNYGLSPAWVRTQIKIEAGPQIIEKLEDPTNALRTIVPDGRGIRKIVLRGRTGDADFPLPQRILTVKDLDDWKSGTIEIVAYGRIEYSDLGNPWGPHHGGTEYYSLFCFYSLPDGTASICPNKQNGYTSWMP